MMDSRKKRQYIWLGSLLVVLVLAVYWVWAPEKPMGSRQASSSATHSPVGGKEGMLTFEKGLTRFSRKKEIPMALLDPVLHVEKLDQFDPGNPSTARNMFALAPPPPPPRGRNNPSSAGSSPSNAATTTPVLPIRPPAPPPVVINLKYLGFKMEEAVKKREGFFTEGDNVFLAGEGELIANRYRVVRLQESWAEIEDLPSKTRQQLHLASQ
jgi:hypothetical protein